jgi:hypothetical protein
MPIFSVERPPVKLPPFCLLPRDRDSSGWAVAKFWLVRPGVPGVALTFPEVVGGRALSAADADAVRMLAPGETFVGDGWRVTRLGGSS